MGCCFSKKNPPLPPSSSDKIIKPDPPRTNITVATANTPNLKSKTKQQQEVDVPRQFIQQDPEKESAFVRKEIFVIKHKKNHEKLSPPPPPPLSNAVASSISSTPPAAEVSDSNPTAIRTSSCTKEELDAILIHCGRLSRSNSSGPTRKFSGSKRSFDFDNNDHHNPDAAVDDCNDADDDENWYRPHRNRHQRQSSRASPSPSKSHGRRRTPSRERDQNQRSGSRERGRNSNGRRVSQSPGRRSETGAPTPAANASVSNNSNSSNRPGKMISVPATVSSLANDKSNNEGGIKRISVKRNAASPRSQSPARINQKNPVDNNQPPTLSRNNSRKAEQSPHRRNPLAEIDTNFQPHPQPTPYKYTSANRVHIRSKDVEGQAVIKESLNFVSNQAAPTHKLEAGSNCKGSSIAPLDSKIGKENQQEVVGGDGLKPQALTRSRSSRQSQDLDLTPEILLNPQSSYTALLLEDIHNFHQKSVPQSSFTLPPCVTKACSIVEAVADLNSTTRSNLSFTFTENAKTLSDGKDPFLESEVLVNDDLMEPSFHKYVTVKRGGTGTLLCGKDMDGQESSGSNSFVGGTSSGSSQQRGVRSSSWEPSSAESTDQWTSRTNNTKEDQRCD